MFARLVTQMSKHFSRNSPQTESEISNGDTWRWSRRRAASDFLLLEGTNALGTIPGTWDSNLNTRRASVSESPTGNNFSSYSNGKNKRSFLPVSHRKFELPYYSPPASSPKSLVEQVGLIRRSAKICNKYFSKLFRQPQDSEKLETTCRGGEDRPSCSSQSSFSCDSTILDNNIQSSDGQFALRQGSLVQSETITFHKKIQDSDTTTRKSETQHHTLQSNNTLKRFDWLLKTLSRIAGEEITKEFVAKVGFQIVFSMLPLIVWFLIFNFYPRLSLSWRPAINTSLLPKLEGLLHFPYRWFATRSSKAADFVAAVPYTIHAILPGMFFLYLLLTDGLKTALCFFASLGVLNTSAVLTQILFPFAPPWYFELNGVAKAEHWMSGNPGAALSRVDKLFGIIFYQETYTTQNRIPFGSFPSLHAAWPSLIMFCFPIRGSHLFKVLAVCYVCLIYWAAMYLQHHYVIDLLGGTLYAYLTYRMVFARKLDMSSLFYKIHWNTTKEKDVIGSSRGRQPLSSTCSRNTLYSTDCDS